MSIDQSFAVAMHAISVIAFSQPGPVSAVFIAEQVNVHPVVIRRVLGKLVNSKLVKSTAGPRGGYALAKPADLINLWDIYSSIRETGGFADRNAIPKANCKEGKQIEAVLIKVYANADAAIENEFKSVTLADILRDAEKKG